MTEEEAHRVAEEAAERAVKRTLQVFGFDIDDPVAMQRDMLYLRSWRTSSEAVKRQGLVVAVGVIVVGLLGLVWMNIRGSP